MDPLSSVCQLFITSLSALVVSCFETQGSLVQTRLEFYGYFQNVEILSTSLPGCNQILGNGLIPHHFAFCVKYLH